MYGNTYNLKCLVYVLILINNIFIAPFLKVILIQLCVQLTLGNQLDITVTANTHIKTEPELARKVKIVPRNHQIPTIQSINVGT